MGVRERAAVVAHAVWSLPWCLAAGYLLHAVGTAEGHDEPAPLLGAAALFTLVAAINAVGVRIERSIGRSWMRPRRFAWMLPPAFLLLPLLSS